MTVMIGIDPHKASHAAFAIDDNEVELAQLSVRAGQCQLEQLLCWARPFGTRTWAIESAGGLGYLLAERLMGTASCNHSLGDGRSTSIPITCATRSRSMSCMRSVECVRAATAAIVQSISPRWGDAGGAAAAVDASGTFEVGSRVEGEELEAHEETPQVGLACVGARAREHFHDDRFGDRDRAVLRNQFGEAPIDGGVAGTVVLDPCRGVGKDHACSAGATSAGTSSIACVPCMASASAWVIGWPARWRRARSTASVLVRSR